MDIESQQILVAFARMQKQAMDVMVDRQRKYGPHNIGLAGVEGVIVRLGDKLERLKNGLKDHGDESVTDTCIDIANYALFIPMLLDGSWPSDRKFALEHTLKSLEARITAIREELKNYE